MHTHVVYPPSIRFDSPPPSSHSRGSPVFVRFPSELFLIEAFGLLQRIHRLM